MTVDALATLTAGLDRDEAIAKEATHPDWDANFEGSVWDSQGWVADVAGDLNKHVARHDPARVLGQAEAIRKVIELHADNGDGRCIVCVHIDVDSAHEFPCPTVRALAGIYTEPTEETETSVTDVPDAELHRRAPRLRVRDH